MSSTCYGALEIVGLLLLFWTTLQRTRLKNPLVRRLRGENSFSPDARAVDADLFTPTTFCSENGRWGVGTAPAVMVVRYDGALPAWRLYSHFCRISYQLAIARSYGRATRRAARYLYTAACRRPEWITGCVAFHTNLSRR